MQFYDEPYEQNGPLCIRIQPAVILEALEAVGPDREAIVDYIITHFLQAASIGDITWGRVRTETPFGGLTMYINQDGLWTKYEESEYADGTRTLPWE